MCELVLCMLIISRCTLFAATGKILAAYAHISRPSLVPRENSAVHAQMHTQSSWRGHLQFQIATLARCVHYLAAARCPPCPHPPKYQPAAAPGLADRGAASVLSPLISPEQSCRSGAEVSPLLFLYFYVFFFFRLKLPIAELSLVSPKLAGFLFARLQSSRFILLGLEVASGAKPTKIKKSTPLRAHPWNHKPLWISFSKQTPGLSPKPVTPVGSWQPPVPAATGKSQKHRCGAAPFPLSPQGSKPERQVDEKLLSRK